MKSFKVSGGLLDMKKNKPKDIQSSQMIVDKVNQIHSGINENNLKLVNQHLMNHFQQRPIVSQVQEPNNPLLKIRNRSKTKFQPLMQSLVNQETETNQNTYNQNKLLQEKDKEIVYYKEHIQQLTEELQKLTEIFESVRKENLSLKKQLEQYCNVNILLQNQKQQILKLEQENLELEDMFKNTLLQQERQRFQSQSSKQSLIIKKLQHHTGQKIKLYDQLSLSEQMNNNSNLSTSFISCPESYAQKQKITILHERTKTNQTVPTLPDSKIQLSDQIYYNQQGKENFKLKY